MPIPRVSVDVQRMRNVIGEWVETNLNIPTYWAHQNIPRPERPYCALNFPAGRWQPFRNADDVIRIAPSLVTVTVNGPVGDGTQHRVRINKYIFEYIAQLGDDEDVVKNALIQAINDGPEPVQAADSGFGEFQVTPATLGSLLSIKALDDLTLVIDETQIVSDTKGVREFRVSFNLHSRSATGVDTLQEMQDVLETSLDELPTKLFFTKNGITPVGIRTPGQDLSAIEADREEVRLQFELRFQTWSRLTRIPNYIEQVQMQGLIDDVPIEVDVEEGP